MTDDDTTFEIWTAYRYGSSFGQPESRLQGGLSADEVERQLRRDHGMLLHNVLIVHGQESTRASKWLAGRDSASA